MFERTHPDMQGNKNPGYLAFIRAGSGCFGRGRTRYWRRGRDSNPRYGFPHTHFPGVRLQPLGHPSAAYAEAHAVFSEGDARLRRAVRLQPLGHPSGYGHDEACRRRAHYSQRGLGRKDRGRLLCASSQFRGTKADQPLPAPLTRAYIRWCFILAAEVGSCSLS